MNKIKEHIDKKIAYFTEEIGKIESNYDRKWSGTLEWVEDELYFKRTLLNEYHELKKLIEEEKQK